MSVNLIDVQDHEVPAGFEPMQGSGFVQVRIHKFGIRRQQARSNR